MEIRQMKYFVEICKTLSFSKAADNCFVSAQGISMAISRLESELNRQLFIRSPRGIIMTPAAKYLLTKTEKILEFSDDINRYFAVDSDYQGILPVAMSPGSIEEFGGQVINVFRKNNPNIQIEVHELVDVHCEAAIINEEFEIGFACGPLSDTLLEARLVKSCPYAIIVHKDHPLASKQEAAVSDLKGLSVSMLRETTKTYSVFRKACQKEGFEPVVSTFVENILSVYDLAQINQSAGISTTLLFDHLNRQDLKAVPFGSDGPSWDLYYINRSGVSLSPIAALFEKTVLEVLANENR